MDTNIVRGSLPEGPQQKPKTACCAGCGLEYPRKVMVTIQEGRHDNLHFFDGDRVCRSCARSNGVEY